MRILKESFARDPKEPHRAATPLELLFDLVYVVAIASAGVGLHHKLQDQHIAEGIFWFTAAFFSIFWCWLNFAWYASAYDNDDTLFRLITFLQIFGALVFAVGVSNFFEPEHRLAIPITGYVIMRIALAIHWLRAAKLDPKRRNTCLRYFAGIVLIQTLWVLAYNIVPKEYTFYYMAVLFTGELLYRFLRNVFFRPRERPGTRIISRSVTVY